MDDDEAGSSLSQNQKKEKKQLQAKIQGLKHGIPKGDKKKKKEVMLEIAKLELELKQKHDKELKDAVNEILVTNSETMENENNDGDTKENKTETTHVSKAQRRKDKKAIMEKKREVLIAQQEEENVRGVRNIEAQKLLKIITARGLGISEVPSDGNCMYKAIEHQLMLKNILTDTDNLREATSKYMRENSHDFMPFLTSPKSGDAMTDDEFNKFCDDTARSTVWGGQLELRALSHIYKRPIEVVQAEGPSIIIGEEYSSLEPLIISYHRHAFRSGEHYNSLAPCEPDAEDYQKVT